MEFLERIFGDAVGYLCLVTITKGNRVEHVFEYPSELKATRKALSEWSTARDVNVYFYPVLFADNDIESSEYAHSPVIAADLDMVSPALCSPRPDIIVESSNGRSQAYWFKTDSEAKLPSSVNGPIKGDTRLKRVPGTRNWKYDLTPWHIKERDPQSLPTFESVCKHKAMDGDGFRHLFQNGDRWSLARLCARLGCDTQETFLTLQASQEARSLLANRVGIDVLYRDALDAVQASAIPSLLTEDEIRSFRVDNESFVSRYVEWASQCTDSPKQYHVAGALMALSCLLSPYIRLPTSFTEFKPNLWFMVLAGTTLTRKTTAQDMAIKLVKCVDPDVVMSTGGTTEGLISGLSDRDNKSALFHRDEISGFLEEVTNKNYLSGMLEMMTRLYDGGSEKRTLRRQVIEVNNPHFNIMCGGIKTRTMELLTTEHYMSGFLPRFLIVCGSTRVEDMNPIGPPTQTVNGSRLELISYLDGLWKHFCPPAIMGNINGHNFEPLNISGTAEAWERIRKLESDAHEIGLSSENPDVFCPIYERTMNSIIKVSILLAADRSYRQGVVTELQLTDVVAAISYSDTWLESAHELARGIENKLSKDELKLIKIGRAIADSEEGLTRSDLMRKFRLTADEVNRIEATLIGRQTIVVCKMNNKTTYRAATLEA